MPGIFTASIVIFATASLYVSAFQPSLRAPTTITMQSNCKSSGTSKTGKHDVLVLGENNANRLTSIRLDMASETHNEDEDEQHSYVLKPRNPYDVHVYYNGPTERNEAMALRTKMQETFTWMRFYSPKDRPIGPHPVPMWEADFGAYENRFKWKDVTDFIKSEHGNLSVLVHPHSTDGDYSDHTKNAFWAGDILSLRIQGWPR